MGRTPLPATVRRLQATIARGLRIAPPSLNRGRAPLGFQALGLPAPAPASTVLTTGRGPGARPKTDEDLGRNVAWVPVRSSWIAALRWVPTGRKTATAYLAEGYIDMKTRPPYQRAYRYGPGISQRQFNTWRVAASRGKYWWRYFTRRWSPARRIA